MKYGICTSPENIAFVSKCGFDYIETAAGNIVNLNKQQIDKIISTCNEYNMPIRSCNCMFPNGIRLTGCDYSLDKIREHVKKLFYNASFFGVEIFSLGSGNQRKIEQDDDYDKCLEQLADAAITVADEAAQYGMKVAIEPLNKGETNIINTVAEGAKLAKEINKPNLFVMADLYHMYVENESIDVLPQFKDILAHVHIANPVGRKYPRKGDGVDYKGIIEFLTDMGYNDKVSIEAKNNEFEKDCEMSGKYFTEMFK